MICPTCRQDFWALFCCEDRAYRCRACRDRMPKAAIPDRIEMARKSRESVAKHRRARHLCIKCGQPAQEYSPGNFSVQCVACNEAQGVKRREASKRRREQ